jgi:hypothetical protein
MMIAMTEAKASYDVLHQKLHDYNRGRMGKVASEWRGEVSEEDAREGRNGNVDGVEKVWQLVAVEGELNAR